MPLVVDASVVVAWAFDEAGSPAREARTMLRRDSAVVPCLWWIEVRNALVQGERRGRITETGTTHFLRELGRVAIIMDHAPSEATLLSLARRYRLTAYDAAYLELAQREALPLATLDEPLARAAKAEGVPLIGAGP